MWIIKSGTEKWAEIQEKPTTYPPEAHAHSVNDVGTGTRNNTTFLRGDGTWAAPSGGTFKYNADSTVMIPQDNADSWVVGSDRLGTDYSDYSKGVRALFDKTNGSFRAGASGINSWDTRGDYSAAFGNTCRAEGNQAFAYGNSNSAAGTASLAGGVNSTAQGSWSQALGSSCSSRGSYSLATGSYAVTLTQGEWARSGGAFSLAGDAQASRVTLIKETTTATAGYLTADSSAPSLYGESCNVVLMKVSTAKKLRIDLVARRRDVQGEMAGFTWEGLVGRDSTGNARVIGTPTTNKWNDAGAAAWTFAVDIDTTDATNNNLRVLVTGEAGKTIRWVASIDAVEVGG